MISRIFIERPKLAFVISIVTVLAGAICIFRLPVAEYPEIAPPSIMVSASYPGASAEVIANTVATVVEEQVNGIEGMIYFSSTSSNAGSYSLTITFEPGTDTDIAQVNVQNAVRRAEPSLPSEVKALGINIKKRSSDILAMYSFTTDGSTLSDLELSNWVRMNVRDGLSRIDGISDAEIMGVRNYSMRIWLDPLRMSALGITPEDIAAAVQNQNVQAAVGTVGAEYANDYLQLKINTLGRLTTVDEFGDIVSRSATRGGRPGCAISRGSSSAPKTIPPRRSGTAGCRSRWRSTGIPTQTRSRSWTRPTHFWKRSGRVCRKGSNSSSATTRPNTSARP